MMSEAKKRNTSTGGFPEVLSQSCQEKYGEELNFQLGYSSTGGSHIIVSSKLCHFHPPAGTISCTRLMVHEDGSFNFQVLLQSKEAGKLATVEDFLKVCSMMIDKQYKFCPGIDPDVYQSTYFMKIRYHIKNVHCSDALFRRVDSINCSLWHKLARNASIIEKDMESVPCGSCKRLVYDLDQHLKNSVSSPTKSEKTATYFSLPSQIYVSR